jgi:hypothetical protein
MASFGSNVYRKYFLGGYDITKYVVEADKNSLVQSKGEWGTLPSIQTTQFTVQNINGLFSSLSSTSMIMNQRIKNIPLKIVYNQGTSSITEWSGKIDNIQEDYQKWHCIINGVSPWQQIMDADCLTPLGDNGEPLWTTPAFISKSIWKIFNIPYNVASYNRAIASQTGRVTVSIDPNMGTSNVTVMQAQQQLATAGFGRIYPVNGEMYYEVFSPAQKAVSFIVNEKDLYTWPKITTNEFYPTGVRVNYTSGPVNSSFVNSPNYDMNLAKPNGQAITLDFSANQLIKMSDINSATICGAQWELIKNQIPRLVEIAVAHSLGYVLDLNSAISLTYSRAGINNIPMEIEAIDRTDSRYTKLKGRIYG